MRFRSDKPPTEGPPDARHEEPGSDAQQTMAYFLARHREHEPKPDAWSDVIAADEIRRDKEYVRDREEKFERMAGVRSRFLEAFLASTEIAEANWFGDEEYPLFMIQTTRFDDIANGIDLVWEWETPEGKVVRLAVDVTVSDEEARLVEKLEKEKRGLAEQSLARVKYFASQVRPEDRGPVRGLPHVVIGTDARGVDHLVSIGTRLAEIERALRHLNQMEEKRTLTSTEKAQKGALEDEYLQMLNLIEHDPVRLDFLDQVQEQLANQIVDTTATFFDREGRRAAFNGDDAAIMETLYGHLRSFMEALSQNRSSALERVELIEMLESNLPAIKHYAAVTGDNLERLLVAHRFILTLILRKEKASGRTRGSSTTQTGTHRVLTRPWTSAPKFTGY